MTLFSAADASNPVIGGHILKGRGNLFTGINGPRAAGVKIAAGRRVNRTGNISFQKDPGTRLLDKRIRDRHRG